VVLLKSRENKFPASWSRDGRFVLYSEWYKKGRTSTWVLPMEGARKPVPLLSSSSGEFDILGAHFSPDGHWVAYTSNESGRNEVYVRSFSMNADQTAVELGAKWPISIGGGTGERWRRDGRELYYQSVELGRLMAVEITNTPSFHAGVPVPLGVSTVRDSVWASVGDGKRFLKLAGRSGPEPYTVLLNWQAALKK
jgi:Tol biopolymer transport system component